MAINGRNKGSAGERECAEWLQKLLALPYKPKRNLEQTRSGGHDLLVEPFLVEVKRVEILALRKWWTQVQKAYVEFDRNLLETYDDVIPIVLFRQNRQKWKCLIDANWIGLPRGFVLLDNLETKLWLKMMYSNTY